jgi:serine/threonine protein kinase
MPIELGQVYYNRYRFEHPIGRGATGIVWKGWHTQMNRPLAIKVIDVSDFDAKWLARAKLECTVAARVGEHAHLVTIYDAFEEGRELFIVMELLDGGSLKEHLRENRVELLTGLGWGLELCAALATVHAEGVIHRDIKPSNILLNNKGQVKLGDFGVARLPDADLTTSYQPCTPAYRSPEQEANQPVDAATDLFSLSAVLFEVFGGERYVRFKSLSPAELRGELRALLESRHPDAAPAILADLADALVGGLAAKSERLSLAALRDGLADIAARLKGGSVAVAQAPRPAAWPSSVVGYLIQPPVAGQSSLPGDTPLIRWLEEDFAQWLLQPQASDTILWFDPAGEWEGLLPHLSPLLNLVRYQGSLLEVRYRLELRRSAGPVVAYLPLPRGQADYLKPYEFSAQSFESDLYTFLVAHGVNFPADEGLRSAIKRSLPQLALASLGRGSDFWDGLAGLEPGRWPAESQAFN